MSNYTKTTSFGPKDSLPTGAAAKIVKGTEFDTEFDNIATHIATKLDSPSSPSANDIATYNGSAWVADAPVYEMVEHQDLTSGSPNVVTFSHTFESGYIYQLVITNASNDLGSVFLNVQWAVAGPTWRTGATDYTESHSWIGNTVLDASDGNAFNVATWTGFTGVDAATFVTARLSFFSMADAVVTKVLGEAMIDSTTVLERGYFAARSGASEAHVSLRISWSGGAAVFDSGDAYIYRIKEVP